MIRVFLVDDDEDDYVLTRGLLGDIPGSFELAWMPSIDKARAALRDTVPDLILLDYLLGAESGLDFLKELRRAGLGLPVIILTGQGDREIDMAAMAAGATDYLVKSELSAAILDRAIRYAMSVSELHRKLLEDHERLQQMEKLSVVGLIAAGIVHEVSNPLTGVMSLVQALHDGKAGDSRDEYFKAVKDGLERMRVTLRSLLDLAREQPLTLAEVDVAELVAACFRLMAATLRSRGITPVQDVPAGLRARADRSRVIQAILNLMMNAADATPSGGSITVSVTKKPGGIGIVVTDTGAGIAPAIAERILEPFFTTKSAGKGTGLGLPFVVQTAKLHGGDLTIASQVGKGTTMTMWLRDDAR